MKVPVVIGAAIALAACSSAPKHTMTNARIVTGSGVAAGGSAEANRRAVADPELAVDRLPGLVAQNPKPFQRMPRGVKSLVDRRGASVKVDVVIDTLGKPVMNSVKVVESKPHAWMGQNVRSLLPRWKFSPAELAGCKVPRVYKFSATAPARR